MGFHMDQATALIIAQTAAAFVTALATIALCWVTAVLARETRVMAARAAEPHVVVTLEPNRWAIHFLDMHIMNSGNAAAYDITTTFDPVLPADGPESWSPIDRVSVLRPGQEIVSSVGRFAALRDQTFKVTVKWRRKSGGPEEVNSYALNLRDYQNFNQLGGDPMVKIANAVEKMQKAK